MYMEAESSDSSVSDFHLGQPSSLTDPVQRDDILTDEDKPLVCHAYLFPAVHSIDKEDLIRLWIADGLFGENQNPRDRVEDDARVKIDSLGELTFFRFHGALELGSSAYDGGYFGSSGDDLINFEPERVRHLRIRCKSFDDTMFNDIKRFKYLRTLFIFPLPGKMSLTKVPCDLFLSLQNLTTLIFCNSLLIELPSSIMCLKSVRYIDLSHTPITKLPDSIDNLQNLQTLKLTDCIFLHQLPNGMCKLTNLRHLDFDVFRQLQSMPPRIGNLTHLQTLSAFLIGKEEGRRIRELRNLGNLTGFFCISSLENVLDLEDVKDAALIDKNYITALELRWTGEEKAENSPEDEEILEHLRPSLRLHKLTILNYGGSKLPTWIGDPSYECLDILSLDSFNNCRLLPSIGELPSLRFLNIAKMKELERIDQLFCRNGSENSQGHAFLRLETLIFEDMPKWEEWTGVQSGDFPSLHNLQLKYCPKLKSLPSLSCLRKSVKILELSYCQSIMPFLDGVEAVSLENLYINDCPELKRCFDRPHGQDWPKIVHVPMIWIDGNLWLSEGVLMDDD